MTSLWVRINGRQIAVLFEIWRAIFNSLRKNSPSANPEILTYISNVNWIRWRVCHSLFLRVTIILDLLRMLPPRFLSPTDCLRKLRRTQIWISRWGSWRLRSFFRSTHIFRTPYCFPSPENEIYSAMLRRSSINEFSDILQRRRDCDRWKPTPSASYFSPSFTCRLSLFLPLFLSLFYTCAFVSSEIVK